MASTGILGFIARVHEYELAFHLAWVGRKMPRAVLPGRTKAFVDPVDTVVSDPEAPRQLRELFDVPHIKSEIAKLRDFGSHSAGFELPHEQLRHVPHLLSA